MHEIKERYGSLTPSSSSQVQSWFWKKLQSLNSPPKVNVYVESDGQLPIYNGKPLLWEDYPIGYVSSLPTRKLDHLAIVCRILMECNAQFTSGLYWDPMTVQVHNLSVWIKERFGKVLEHPYGDEKFQPEYTCYCGTYGQDEINVSTKNQLLTLWKLLVCEKSLLRNSWMCIIWIVALQGFLCMCYQRALIEKPLILDRLRSIVILITKGVSLLVLQK